jgi:hypothetical protein
LRNRSKRASRLAVGQPRSASWIQSGPDLAFQARPPHSAPRWSRVTPRLAG